MISFPSKKTQVTNNRNHVFFDHVVLRATLAIHSFIHSINLRTYYASCWGTIFPKSQAFQHILHTEALGTLVSRFSFQRFLCIKQPWKIELVSPSGAKGRQKVQE